jgi:nucleotide-binding universal stress UspA family protein
MAVTLARPVRQDGSRYEGRVIVGVDDSPGGLAALRWAAGLARSRKLPLVAVRAWALGLPRHGGRRGHSHGVVVFEGAVQRRAAAELTRRAFRDAAGEVSGDLDLRIETPEGNPGPVLTELASPDDVLVVGTRRGHHSLRRAVHGSVSGYCAGHARCPVAVVAAGGRARRGDFHAGSRG